MDLLILTADSNGGYPVPATKGGAVSTLIESLVAGDNEKNLCDMTVMSIWDGKAEKIANESYPNIHFIWIKVPRFIKALDNILFKTVKTFFKKKKVISYKSIFSLLYYINSASKYLKKSSYEKVVLENNVPLAKVIEKSKYKGQYYYHLHNVPRINGGCQQVFDNCTAFLCVSKYVGQEIEKKSNAIGPVPKEKVRVLYNAIDTELFKPFSTKERTKVREEIKRKYNIPADNKIIIFTGRLSQEKGVDKLLEAVKGLESISVLICGGLFSALNLDDPYQDKIHQLAKELDDKVVFTGYVDQKDLPNYYNTADVAVLPSMWDEPAGLTMIEAMACGIPVITTESGGIPEYVGDEAIVLKRDSDLVNNITSALESVFQMSYEQSEMLEKDARKRIVNHFSRADYLENFISVIS